MHSFRLLSLAGFLALSVSAASLPDSNLNVDPSTLDYATDQKRSALTQVRSDIFPGQLQPDFALSCLPGDEDCSGDGDAGPGALEKRGRVPSSTKKGRKTTATGSKRRKGKGKITTPTSGGGSSDKTADYLVVEQAAKKAGKTLKVGQSYLLTEKSDAIISHHKLILVKIVERKAQKARKGRKAQKAKLDAKGTMHQLILDGEDRGTCFELFGGKCKSGNIRNYKCSNKVLKQTALLHYNSKARFEFADPETFLSTGDAILIQNTKYNIFSNNCQIHATNVQKVTAASSSGNGSGSGSGNGSGSGSGNGSGENSDEGEGKEKEE